MLVAAAVACGRSEPPAAVPAPLPQTSGTLALAGLAAPVRVVRDRSGVPHIYASNDADLFFAQGFVQAQDRLFQMDLWRRASLGQLSEVLGANFVDRDGMTRRIQYHGDPAAEWESYGADVRSLAEAFVRGINAWVSIARQHPPEEFVQVRWPPAYWRAEDLLNRTDAFVDGSTALELVRQRHLPDVVADAVRLVGTPPFLAGATPAAALTRTRSPTWAAAAAGRVTSSEAPAMLAAPSVRYLVHLVAPGWNVIGATAPWLPGVAVGHTDRVAWSMQPSAADSQDVVVEPAEAVVDSETQRLRVKGRAEMQPFTRDATRDGVVIATDREREQVFVLRWRGFEQGMAAGLGALALDRARDRPSFREAAKRWRMPARRIVYADVDGHVETMAGRAGADPGTSESTVAVAERAIFPHLIHRFDVGPLPRPADDAPLQLAIDVSSWDRSRAISAPGQSGAPASSHYADGAQRWSSGAWSALWFSEDAVRANAESTLTLTPASPR